MRKPVLVPPTLLLAMAAMLSRGLSAQSDSAAAVLVGVVRDSSGRAVQGALVRVRDRQTSSNALGAFQLSHVPVGTHALHVRRVGYLPQSLQVTLFGGDTLTARLTLARIVTLDSIEVTTAKSGIAEFEERRAQGTGHYITRAELEKYPSQRVAEVLGRVPGLRVASNRTRGESFAMSGRGPTSLSGTPCFTQVYIDDFPVYGGAPQAAFNLNSLATVDIEGIEFYRGGAALPAKYNRTGSACGVLIIWTRR